MAAEAKKLGKVRGGAEKARAVNTPHISGSCESKVGRLPLSAHAGAAATRAGGALPLALPWQPLARACVAHARGRGGDKSKWQL
jgi:hypothetical protein